MPLKIGEETARRMAKAIRRSELTPHQGAVHLPPMAASGSPENWRPGKNDSGETIDAYSIVGIDNTGSTIDGRFHLHAKKPSTTFYKTYAFTSGLESISGAKVGLHFGYGFVRYDTGTPVIDAYYGVKPGQFTVSLNYPGNIRCLGIVDSTRKIMFAAFEPWNGIYAKCTSAMSANAVATGNKYTIYKGTQGSETDAGFETVPDVFVRGGAIAVNDPIWITPGQNGLFAGKLC